MGNRLERIGCFGAGQIASQGIGRRRRRVSCRLCDRLSGGCREVCRYPGGYCLRGGPWARVAAPALGSGIAVAVHPEAAISIGRWIVLPFAKCGWLNATTVSGSRPRAAIRRSPFMSPDRTRPARTSSRPCADGISTGPASGSAITAASSYSATHYRIHPLCLVTRKNCGSLNHPGVGTCPATPDRVTCES